MSAVLDRPRPHDRRQRRAWYTAIGRRFRVVGANPVASGVVGLRVSLNQYAWSTWSPRSCTRPAWRWPGGSAGRASTSARIPPAPIAAVAIGGASLTGGLASPISTFAAALFLTGLNQMMLVMGLPTALQSVVFGLA